MAETIYQVNAQARCTAVFQVGGVDSDPTAVTFTVRDPLGVVTTPNATKDSTGHYHADVTVTVPGTWMYVYRGTGAVVAEGQSDFFVTPDYSAARTNLLAWITWDLATALRDTTLATWDSREMDTLVTQAVARLYPRFSRAIAPASATIALVAGTYYYNLPASVIAVSRVDLLDSSGDDLGPINGRAWEITGDIYGGTAQMHISPQIASTAGTLKLHGYARYDVTTNLIPDDFVPIVIARARAEAYRRVLADRARFKTWLSRNQSQNVSVNELVQEINEADAEIARLERQHRVWQKPVPARQGY